MIIVGEEGSVKYVMVNDQHNKSGKITRSLYVPVAIPTCNRLEHLKKCLQSLRLNSDAKMTEVYISVDYPPNNRYESDYNKLVEYLKKEMHLENSGFKSMHIFFQNENLGAQKNMDYLREIIRKEHDCVLITEDDNVFDVEALAFVNICLQRYENSDDVYFVSLANSNKKDLKKKEIVLHPYFTGYGYAYWFKKFDVVREWISISNLNDIKCDLTQMIKLRWKNKSAFNQFFSGFIVDKASAYYLVENNDHLHPIDLYIGMFCVLNNKYTAYPFTNLVSNIGNDGSGINSHRNDVSPFMLPDNPIIFNDVEECVGTGKVVQYYKNVADFMRGEKRLIEYLFWYAFKQKE